jgi:DNA-binding XRE family transcriptional regulator
MKKLKQIRIREGFTQLSLALAVGITQSAICRFEKGEDRPNLYTFVKIAKVLKVEKISDLV